MTRVKICGITNAEDARWAAHCGADALGFVFADSPRHIQVEDATQIIRGVEPFATCVGVFARNTVAEVRRTLEEAGCSVAQLHGEEPASYIQALAPHPVVKAFRVLDHLEADVIAPYRGAQAILLDTYVAGRLGGTGERFDLALAAELVRQGWRVIVAGGLTPENVGETIRTVRPYAVDVSSGVEIAPGKKHPAKVADFIAAVRAADREDSGQR